MLSVGHLGLKDGVQVIWWGWSQEKYMSCGLWRKSPSADSCEVMVLSGDGRTVNFHIKAQAQPVSRLCCIQFQLFSIVAHPKSQGIFVVPVHSLWESCVSCRNLKNSQRFSFWASKNVCVCVCVFTYLCVHTCFKERKTCAPQESHHLFPLTMYQGHPRAPSEPSGYHQGQISWGLKPSAPNSF